jgi:hypothetical protein
MPKAIKQLIEILDSTPSEYQPRVGKRAQGQSVVELALITPILIIMLMGLAEIGWFANNYLTLLDVTRAGARRATTLQDALSPRQWPNRASYMPPEALPVEFQMPYVDESGNPLTGPDLAEAQSLRRRYRDFAGFSGCGSQRAFYNEVICTMTRSLEPLQLNPNNDIDDIIVSGFAIENVDASRFSTWLGPNRPFPGQNIPQLVVAGRWPTNANECDVQERPPGSGILVVQGRDPRDPFDIDENGVRTIWDNIPFADGNNDFSEIEGFDPRAANTSLAEKQVGYVWLGQHVIPNTRCIGSEWTIADVERLVNLPNYSLSSNDERRLVPAQGLVLVEIYWQHELLLKFPLFNPVYSLLGDRTILYVWSAFPLPTTEPYDLVFPPA